MTTPQAGAPDAAGRAWVRKDLTPASERRSGDFALGLASLPFVGRTLRRRARTWCLFGFIGLLIGAGLYVKAPPPYQAQTRVLLAQPADVNPLDAIETDVTLAQTRGVAGAALHKLGLTESVTKFLTSYTAAALTDEYVQFTVGGPSPSQAVARAKALAAAFLQFRALELETTQGLVAKTLKRQISAQKEQYDTLKSQLAITKAEAPSPAQTAKLNNQKAACGAAYNKLNALQGELKTNPVATQSLVSGSSVLDAAASVPRSRFRVPALYSMAGLIAGIAVGMGYVVAAGLMTDRLRRRDDVARALGTPVRLTVGRLRLSRRPGKGGIQSVRRPEVQKMAALLRSSLPPRRSGTAATLAVVAVDDARCAALPVLSLAVAAARAGSQVIVADLTTGAVAAQLLGITDPGVRIVATGGQQIALVVPERGDLTPAGPVHRTTEPVLVSRGSHWQQRQHGQGFPDRAFRRRGFVSPGMAGPLAAAYESADLMLTVATLDPGLGAEHLSTWTAKAMVVVTAGQASATKIHAAGEMLRLAGLALSGAMLVGADKSDLSVGTVPARAVRHQPARAGRIGATGR